MLTTKEKLIIGLAACVAAPALLTAQAQEVASTPEPIVRGQDPRNTGVATPIRTIRDKNGNVVFNAPVPIKSREVKAEKRKAPTIRTRRSDAEKTPAKTKTSSGGLSRTLQAAKEAREKRKAEKALQIKRMKDHVFKTPAPDFLSTFQTARLNAIGPIYLMVDTAKKLMETYPEACRFLPKFDERDVTETGTILCENAIRKPGEATVYPMGAGPQRVYFKYLLSNDVLVGVDMEFPDRPTSMRFYENFTKAHTIARESFTEETGNAVDSPFWRVSRGEDFGRFWVRAMTNFSESSFIEDEKEKKKASFVKMGDLELGISTAKDMPKSTDECRQLGIDREKNTYEYWGRCFGFPENAHYQLDFGEDGRLESYVLRPKSSGIMSDIAGYLADRFGTPKRCRLSFANSVKTIVKDNPEAMSFKFNYVLPVITSATVYAGTCERPFIFESPERFFFTTKQISASGLELSYARRKAVNQARIDRQAERSSRQKDVREYFSRH